MATKIKATPENAHMLRELIAGWPELAKTIRSLRRQEVFPGLRCITVTLDKEQAPPGSPGGSRGDATSQSKKTTS